MKYLLIVFFIGCLMISCQDHCDGPSTPIPFELSSEGSNRICIMQNVDKEKTEVNVVIKTQAEFEKYVGCSTNLQVDFSSKMVLAGRYLSNHCAEVTSQSVEKNCNGEIVYNIEISKGDCDSMSLIFYLVIVDKSGSPVKFNLSIKP
jgi:hypothetical protein